MTDSLIKQLLKDPPFDKVMSVGARKLRDDVYFLCHSHLSPNDTKKFIDHITEHYNPINWEIPIFYHHQERIFEGVMRRTSSKYKEKVKDRGADPPKWQRGTKAAGAGRRKDIDWFRLAVFEDTEFWREMIDFPREKLHLYPADVKKIEPAFSQMYELFTGWLLADFNFTTLYNIFEFARDYSTTFIQECMNKVDDPRKRSTSYLEAVIRQEMAVLKHEIGEDQSLTEHSKMVISKMLEMVEKREDIDWDKIEQDAAQGEENRRIFRKVKLS